MNSEPRLTGFHSTFASAYTALLRYELCCFGWLCFGLFVVGWVVVWRLALMPGLYLLSVPIGDLCLLAHIAPPPVQKRHAPPVRGSPA